MRAVRALAAIEARLFLRDPLSVVFAIAFPFFVLFLLASVFGNTLERDDPEEVTIWRGVGPADYYVPAYVGLIMASIGVLSVPLRLAAYRESGVLRRFRAAGVPLSAIAGSQIAVCAGVAAVGAVSITIAARVAYGTFWPHSWAGAMAAYALSLAMFSAFGLLLGATLRSQRAAQGAGLILFFVMMFISGAGPPRLVLTDTTRTFSEALPLTHVILLLQAPWLEGGWDWSAAAVVSGIGVASAAIGLRFFRWE